MWWVGRALCQYRARQTPITVPVGRGRRCWTCAVRTCDDGGDVDEHEVPSTGGAKLNALLGLPHGFEPVPIEDQPSPKRKMASESDKRWALFLGHLATGRSVVGCLREIGVSAGALSNKKSRDPQFRHRYDQIRHQQRAAKGEVPDYDGTSAGFAMRFIPPPEDTGIDWPNEPYSYSFFQHAVTNALDSCEEGQVVLITIPPGGRKTSTLENWAVKEIARNPEVRIGYISKSGDHAEKSCGRIKNILHDDPTLAPDLIARYGPFHDHGQERKGKPWASKRFTVGNKTSSTRDYTFSAAGAGNQIYGARFDVIIIDDFQTNQNIDQTDKLLHQFRFEIMSRRPTGVTADGRLRGRIVIIGTRVGEGDIYERMIEEFGGEEWFKHVDFPVIGSDGASLDPECFPDEVIPQLRRQVGELVWATSYQQRPPASSNPTFSKSDLERAKKPKLLLGFGELDADGVSSYTPRPLNLGTVVMLDPNLGAGYTVCAAAAFSEERFRLLDIEERFGLSRTEDILDLLEQFLQRYQPDDVRIEANNFQRGLARDDRLMGNTLTGTPGLRQRYGCQISEHMTTGKNRQDDVIGISRMSKSFIVGEIDLPYGDQLAQAKTNLLVEELAAWRPKVSGAKLKQDRVMTLWFGWLVWQERRGRVAVNRGAGGWQTRGISRPAGYRPVTAGR